MLCTDIPPFLKFRGSGESVHLNQHNPRPRHREVTQRGPGPGTPSSTRGCTASGGEASWGPPSWPRGPGALTELAAPKLSSCRPAGLACPARGRGHGARSWCGLPGPPQGTTAPGLGSCTQSPLPSARGLTHPQAGRWCSGKAVRSPSPAPGPRGGGPSRQDPGDAWWRGQQAKVGCRSAGGRKRLLGGPSAPRSPASPTGMGSSAHDT